MDGVEGVGKSGKGWQWIWNFRLVRVENGRMKINGGFTDYPNYLDYPQEYDYPYRPSNRYTIAHHHLTDRLIHPLESDLCIPPTTYMQHFLLRIYL
jgi:hypothetical protein